MKVRFLFLVFEIIFAIGVAANIIRSILFDFPFNIIFITLIIGNLYFFIFSAIQYENLKLPNKK